MNTMLQQVTEGIWTHSSKFLQSNVIVVHDAHGVLLIDPGITSEEMARIATDV